MIFLQWSSHVPTVRRESSRFFMTLFRTSNAPQRIPIAEDCTNQLSLPDPSHGISVCDHHGDG